MKSTSSKSERKRARPHRPLESVWAPPADLGPVVRVGLVGCGKQKGREAKPARELYTGALFRASLEHAIATSDVVFIVSAKYGLVKLDSVIEPYDLRVEDMPTERSRQWWGESVVRELVSAFPERALDVTLWMGGAYTDLLVAPFNRGRIAWARPLDGYPIGLRLSWLARERQQRADAAAAAREAAAEEERKASERASSTRLLVGERGQLELPHVGPLSRQRALF